MSHNNSPTITQNNTVIYVNSVNTAGQTFGLSNLPAGTPAPIATQQLLAQMQSTLITKFGTTFSGQSLPPSNHDGGYMGPWADNVAGTAPACCVQQIQTDFNNWGLPTDGASQSIPVDLAQEITQEISSQGGGAGFASGTKQVTGSELIYWMVGYATVSIAQDELGILYVFAATMEYIYPSPRVWAGMGEDMSVPRPV